MNRLVFWSITSALAGFLFGFDTVVISGAEQKIQALWGLSGSMHGWAMSAALWGTVLGSFIGGWPTDRFGRKKTLISIGVLYFVSAVWSALANDVHSFIIARFIGGLGVGISTVVAPLYISEIAPPDKRGRLAGMFQFNIVFGILIAFLSNSLIGDSGENGWRWMLGVEAIPAVIYALMCFGIPESPRWLISKKGDRDQGMKVLGMIDPEASQEQLAERADAITQSSTEQTSSAGFWSNRLRVPILLAFLIAFFNQLSGINVILYFAPRLLGLAGIENALTASVFIGITNLIFTFVGLYLIDRLGRRTLLYIGSFGYILSLGLCGLAFLSFGELKIVSKAIDLISASENVVKLESEAGASILPEDATGMREQFAAAQVALAEVSAVDSYQGAPVVIPEGSDAGAVKAIGEAAKKEASDLLGSKSLLVLLCIMAFIAAHAVGQGAVIWVFISEIFPNQYRAPGQSLGCFTHWILAALLTMAFPIAIARFDAGYLFLFFCAMMVLQLIWVKLMVPETKGVSLEDMEKQLGVQS